MAARSKATANFREKALHEIRSRILSGEYNARTPLSEYQISKDLGVSRTPIREALRELAKSGLVEILPKRGIFVRTLSPTDILEIFQIRELLEGQAARIAAMSMTADQMAAMRQDHEASKAAAKKGRKQEAYKAAVKMHQHILGACNNRRIEYFLHMLDDQVHLLGMVTLAAPGRLDLALQEHEGIVAAIEQRNGDAAEERIRAHLRLDRDVAIERLTPTQVGAMF